MVKKWVRSAQKLSALAAAKEDMKAAPFFAVLQARDSVPSSTSSSTDYPVLYRVLYSTGIDTQGTVPYRVYILLQGIDTEVCTSVPVQYRYRIVVPTVTQLTPWVYAVQCTLVQ